MSARPSLNTSLSVGALDLARSPPPTFKQAAPVSPSNWVDFGVIAIENPSLDQPSAEAAEQEARQTADAFVSAEGSSILDRHSIRIGGAGHPIPPSARERLEAYMGHDFGAVRVHAGPAANRVTHRLAARAVTIGDQIFFGRSAVGLDGLGISRLLAHELVHVCQQSSAPALPGALGARSPKLSTLRCVAQRDAVDAVAYRDEHWETLGADLAQLVKDGDNISFVLSVLDEVSWFSSDDVALAIALNLDDDDIRHLAGSPRGISLLDRLTSDMSAAWGYALPYLDGERSEQVGRIKFLVAKVNAPPPSPATVLEVRDGIRLLDKPLLPGQKLPELPATSKRSRYLRLSGELGGERLAAEVRREKPSGGVVLDYHRLWMDVFDTPPILQYIDSVGGGWVRFDMAEVGWTFWFHQPALHAAPDEVRASETTASAVKELLGELTRRQNLRIARLERPALDAAEASTRAFLRGFGEGLGEVPAAELGERLAGMAMLNVVFPIPFLAGTAEGLFWQGVDALKSLDPRELAQLTEMASEITRAMFGPDGEDLAEAMGQSFGASVDSQITDLLNSGTFSFAYQMGKLFGPTVIAIVCALLGVEIGALELIEGVLKTLRANSQLARRLDALMDRFPIAALATAGGPGKGAIIPERPERFTGPPRDPELVTKLGGDIASLLLAIQKEFDGVLLQTPETLGRDYLALKGAHESHANTLDLIREAEKLKSRLRELTRVKTRSISRPKVLRSGMNPADFEVATIRHLLETRGWAMPADRLGNPPKPGTGPALEPVLGKKGRNLTGTTRPDLFNVDYIEIPGGSRGIVAEADEMTLDADFTQSRKGGQLYNTVINIVSEYGVDTEAPLTQIVYRIHSDRHPSDRSWDLVRAQTAQARLYLEGRKIELKVEWIAMDG